MELRQRHCVTFRPGFSLTEVLLVMGIVAVVAAISTAGIVSARQRAGQTKEVTAAETLIRQAQQRALTAREGKSWVVRCDTTHLQTFVSPANEADKRGAITFESGVTCQPGTSVHFKKLTGLAESEASFVLRAKGQSFYRIQISAAGIISASPL
jgi:prepilin-type N-terminal cleavage/methylation domain-containing protein